MKLRKPHLTFWQIINMNVGFFGIQYSFGLQQSAVNPIYDFLGARPDQIPILNLAGPLTGLVIQPIIGALSDKTWNPRWGRRTPYFFIGAMICSIALFLFPFSSALWMATGLLWLLDVGNNTAQEPYRAFIADKLDESQQPVGFQAQSFFTGFGQTLANLSLFIFPLVFIGKTGKLPTWVFASFFLGAVCSIGSICWSIFKTPEIPPSPEELSALNERNKGMPHPLVQIFLSVLTTIVAYSTMIILVIPAIFYRRLFQNLMEYTKQHPTLKVIFAQNIEIIEAMVDMPRVMWQLALIYLFQWYALFCYWQNSSKSVALSVWNATPGKNESLYEKAVSWTGLVNGWYNVVTFLSAFALVWFARKYSAKLVHFGCLVLAGAGFLAFPHIGNKFWLFPAITGFGIGWASMMGIPYLMVVNKIPKERYGVYMGIINMMIVIPMFIQTTTFGYILKHFLHDDARNAITFAGIFLFIAAAATLMIRSEKPNPEVMIPAGSGH
jgi:maltose/moltooligosaccharide transporter